jgi:hypothetical protein
VVANLNPTELRRPSGPCHDREGLVFATFDDLYDEQRAKRTIPGKVVTAVARSEVRVRSGRPLPLVGVGDCYDGFNFTVFSCHAKRVELLIFAVMAGTHPLWTFDLDPIHHRTSDNDIWDVLMEGVIYENPCPQADPSIPTALRSSAMRFRA